MLLFVVHRGTFWFGKPVEAGLLSLQNKTGRKNGRSVLNSFVIIIIRSKVTLGLLWTIDRTIHAQIDTVSSNTHNTHLDTNKRRELMHTGTPCYINLRNVHSHVICFGARINTSPR